MDALIETFHIDIKLLIAQAINFAIVISVLYFFILKPLIITMKDRTAKIEKSMADADKIQKKLKTTEEDYRETVNKAKKEAGIILEKAKVAADEKKDKMILKAKEDIGQIINEEKAKIQREKAATLKEIKSEVANLVAVAVEKVLEEKLDPETDKKLIKRLVK